MTLLTADERLAHARAIRQYALKLLAYYLVLLPVTLVLAVMRWIGERAEAAYELVDLPAYRWRSAQEECRRELVRDNRRRKRAADPDCELP